VTSSGCPVTSSYPGASRPQCLERELDAAHAAGLNRVELLPTTPALGAEAGPALRFPAPGSISPAPLSRGTRHGGRAARRAASSPTSTPRGWKPRAPPTAIKTRDRASVTAGAVIAATNAPILGPPGTSREAGRVSDLRESEARYRRARSRVASTGTPRIRITTCACSRAPPAGRERDLDRGRRGPQDRPVGRQCEALSGARGVGARALSDDRGGGVPLVGAGHELPRRASPSLAGRRRTSPTSTWPPGYRHGDDAWNDRRHAAPRSHPPPGQSVARAVRPVPTDPTSPPRPRAART